MTYAKAGIKFIFLEKGKFGEGFQEKNKISRDRM
jgi:hypothetical protein